VSTGVNECTKPECESFKAWVAEVVVRLEEWNIRADEEFVARVAARNGPMAKCDDLMAEGNWPAG
jgi:hypothetical protein